MEDDAGERARERKRGEQEVTSNHEEHKSRGFRGRSRLRNHLPRAKDRNSLLANIGKTKRVLPAMENPVSERHLHSLSLKSRRRFTLFANLFARYPFKAFPKMNVSRIYPLRSAFSSPRLLVESEILLPLPFQFSALSDYFQVRCTFVRGNFHRRK